MRLRAALVVAVFAATASSLPAVASTDAAGATPAPSAHSIGACALPSAWRSFTIPAPVCAAWRAPRTKAPAPVTPTQLPVCLTHSGINDRCERWSAMNANQPAASGSGFAPVAGLAVDPANGLSIIATNASPGGVQTLGAAAYSTRTGAARWSTSAGAVVPAGVPTATDSVAISPDGAIAYVAGAMAETVSVNQRPYTFYFVMAVNASTGRILWANRYLGLAGGQSNQATAAVATRSQVILTGFSVQPGPFQVPPVHYATVAFAARTGRLLWVSRYMGVNGTNIPTAIATTPSGDRVFVTGYSQYYDPAPGTVYQYATVAYRTTDGSQLWARTRRSPVAASSSYGTALAYSAGRVYVTGLWQYAGTPSQPSFDYGTTAYTSSGRQLWTATHLATANGTDLPTDITVAGARVIVTGSTSGARQTVGTGLAAVTVSVGSAETVGYDLAGHLKWASEFQSPASEGSFATALAVGPHGHVVYVGGALGPTPVTTYPLVLALNAVSGATDWVARYDLRDPASFSTTLVSPAEAPVGIGVDPKAGLLVDAVPENPTLATTTSQNGTLLLGYAL